MAAAWPGAGSRCAYPICCPASTARRPATRPGSTTPTGSARCPAAGRPTGAGPGAGRRRSAGPA
ncbi:hypothetical protein DLJ60_00150, partial [Micromonospora chalcea]